MNPAGTFKGKACIDEFLVLEIKKEAKTQEHRACLEHVVLSELTKADRWRLELSNEYKLDTTRLSRGAILVIARTKDKILREKLIHAVKSAIDTRKIPYHNCVLGDEDITETLVKNLKEYLETGKVTAKPPRDFTLNIVRANLIRKSLKYYQNHASLNDDENKLAEILIIATRLRVFEHTTRRNIDSMSTTLS